ncbi:hypothetical protein [Streptomyces mirabilis]|uniref:hypothetical protein n=1 Tax=Streptomyces mirabilis TaxID=68239 RepID=UPI0036DDB28A
MSWGGGVGAEGGAQGGGGAGTGQVERGFLRDRLPQDDTAGRQPGADERGGQVAVAEGENGGLDPARGDHFGAGALLDGGAQGGQEPPPGQAGGPVGGGRGGGGGVVGQGSS